MTIEQINSIIEDYQRWRDKARRDLNDIDNALVYWEQERVRAIEDDIDKVHLVKLDATRAAWHETLRAEGIDVASAERLLHDMNKRTKGEK